MPIGDGELRSLAGDSAAVDVAGGVELTNSQLLLWTGQQLHPESPLYNMVLSFAIDGSVDAAHFNRAFNALLARSDALRTVVEDFAGVARQRVRPPFRYAVEQVDLSGTNDPALALRSWIAERSVRRFRPGELLFDTALIRLADRYVWYLAQHHLITDGWSTALVYRYVSELYRSSLDGRLSDVHPLPSYAAYAAYENAFRLSPLYRKVSDHWEKKLATLPEPIRLYGKRRAPTSTRTERVTRELGAERSTRIRTLAAGANSGALSEHSATFQLFATALFAYLHRVSDQRRLAIGAPSHNRPTADFKKTIGLFIEVFPLVLQLADEETFDSLLGKVRSEAGLFLRYAQPGTSTPATSRGVNVLLNYIHASFPPFDGLPMRSEWVHAGHGDSRHHLRVQVHDFDAAGSFVLHFDFSQDLFAAEEREEAADHFLRVLDAFLEDPFARISEVDLLGTDERRRVLAKFSACASSAPIPSTIVGMFEEQVVRTPDAVALVCEDSRLTYHELDRRSAHLARRLRDRGVGAESLVGLFAERSAEAVIGILGILRAGGAFVPISPDDPPARSAQILRDAGARVVVTCAELLPRLTEYVGELVLLGSEERTGVGSAAPRPEPPSPSDPAYVLYTSGSTGVPKGVVVEHEALAHYVGWAKDYYLRGVALDLPLFTSLAFDLTLTSLFLPLVSGGQVVIYRDTEDGVPALFRVVEENRVDAIKLTPTHLTLIRGSGLRGSRVKTLIVGGEELKTEEARSAKEIFGGVEIFNEYGPTEATVGCMIHRFDAGTDTDTSVPIGRAAAAAGIYLLDGSLNPVPAGVVAEIVVGGPGLARGYLNRAELTAERFPADPLRPGERMYRTGDLGRWRTDGVMEYLGRADHQVKIRGARVEPAEVESALLDHPALEACVVDVIRFAVPTVSDQSVFCTRCGLPSNYPGASYDADGVCQLCLGFDTYREKVRGYFRSMEDLRSLFEKARARRTGEHDCLMLLSGGKDSTYALYQLVRMGMRVLTFTLDNGYLSDEAKTNIRRVTESLQVEHVFGTTAAMNEIFVDSLKRYSNVCNGCFKTLYTLGTKLARSRGIPVVVTGLSRGQFFETRLTEELFLDDRVDSDRIDRIVLEARKAYHRADDAVARLLDVREFRDDAVYEEVQFVDFYRYSDATLDEMLAFLSEHAPWIRPRDTGRSTNCRINEVGIFVHRKERGYHNYAFPYSWDVRIGHKSRDAALYELGDQLDLVAVRRILTEIGYTEPLRADDASEARLAAYYVARSPVTASELRAHLGHRLPAYMAPSHFIRLESLPLTPHGKIDRASLPSPEAGRPELIAVFVAPRNPVEARVAAIWADVLKVRRVGMLDEFLDLGGNSLLAIQLIARVNQAFQLELPLQSAFEASTVASFSRLIEETLLREVAALSEEDVERLTGSL